LSQPTMAASFTSTPSLRGRVALVRGRAEGSGAPPRLASLKKERPSACWRSVDELEEVEEVVTDRGGEGAGFPELHFHDLRHTAATALVAEQVEIKRPRQGSATRLR
jgi:integrase